MSQGRWEAIADLCADQLADPTAAAAALKGLTSPVPAPLQAMGPPLDLRAELLSTDEIRFHGDLPVIMHALDCFMRVQCGQWNRAADVRFGVAPDALGHALLELRVSQQRVGAYLPNPQASIGIDRAPQGARVAYHVWKRLGGGTEAKPTFSIGALEVHRTEDGRQIGYGELLVTSRQLRECAQDVSNEPQPGARPAPSSSSVEIQWRLQAGTQVDGDGLLWRDVSTHSSDKPEMIAQLEWRRTHAPEGVQCRLVRRTTTTTDTGDADLVRRTISVDDQVEVE